MPPVAPTAIPLRALPLVLPRGGDWVSERDAAHPPLLAHQVGRPLELPLDLPPGTRLQGQVRLAQLSWRDGFGHCTVAVETLAGGARWERSLGTANAGSRPEEHALDLELPAGPVVLRLSAEARAPRRTAPVTEVYWRDLRLLVPGQAGTVAAGTPVAATTEHAAPDGDGPLVSIVMPVCDPAPELLRSTLDSVHAQSDGDWQLCITDDRSTDPAVLEMLAEEQAAHPERVVVRRHEVRQGISAATNTALTVARGRYVAMLDHDDLLHPDAVRRIAEVAASDDPDIVYSDDEIQFGTRKTIASHKPGFSLEMIRGLMYTHHLSVYRRALLDRIGGLRSAFDGSQDHDMMLRLLELEPTPSVVHVPEILYTWRAHAGSMAGNPNSKPLAFARSIAALGEHLQRTGVGGRAVYGGHVGRYRHLPDWPAGTSASIALAATADDERSLTGLRQAAASWRDGHGRPWPVVVGTTAAARDAVVAALAAGGVDDRALTVALVPDDEPHRALAAAAAAVTTDVVLLLRAPAVWLSARWLETLGGHVLLDDVHAAGVRILAADGRVESAGIVLRDGAPQRLLAGAPGNDHGPYGVARFTRALAALDDAVVATRADLDRLGGLDPAHGPWALADHCLRGNATGTRTVFLSDLLAGRPIGPPAGPVDVASLAAFTARWAGAEPAATVPTLTPLALSEPSSTRPPYALPA
ncbi:glycosyltransferase [Patulibacter defluvii]|uniref:glycosyltransferase n=1 Tax=Patulibacter defluvii TaxID=3095358 RepID=UPI002A757D3A|nr:glycosyltransferase [Patulibacter sp. DM4]